MPLVCQYGLCISLDGVPVRQPQALRVKPCLNLKSTEIATGMVVLLISPSPSAHRVPFVTKYPSSPLFRVSPNVPRNAAIFPVDDPSVTPLIADATIVVVNDARHQLEGNFLQRTVPYFFELTGGHPSVASGGRYRWAKVWPHFLPPRTAVLA